MKTPSPDPNSPPFNKHPGVPVARIMSILGPFLALGLVTAFFGIADSMQEDGGAFLTIGNLRLVTIQIATVAVAALGMTVIIIAGGIDLSAGTAIALSATVLAWCLLHDVALLVMHGEETVSATIQIRNAEQKLHRDSSAPISEETRQQALQQVSEKLDRTPEELVEMRTASETWSPWTPWISIPLAVLVGAICGWLNGMLVSYLRVVSFIVTLGTMQIFLGIAKRVADETTVRPDTVTQVPQWLNVFLSRLDEHLWPGPGWPEFLRFPPGIWMLLLMSLLLALVLRFSVFGRYVFALGSNESTARLCGVNVRWNKIAVYSLGGLFIGLAGLYQFSRLSVGNPTSGIGLELQVIAAVVIGGGSLNGGRGSVLGTLTGAAIMAVIASGCTQLELKNSVQDVVLGVIIIAAVAADQLRTRSRA